MKQDISTLLKEEARPRLPAYGTLWDSPNLSYSFKSIDLTSNEERQTKVLGLITSRGDKSDAKNNTDQGELTYLAQN